MEIKTTDPNFFIQKPEAFQKNAADCLYKWLSWFAPNRQSDIISAFRNYATHSTEPLSLSQFRAYLKTNNKCLSSHIIWKEVPCIEAILNNLNASKKKTDQQKQIARKREQQQQQKQRQVVRTNAVKAIIQHFRDISRDQLVNNKKWQDFEKQTLEPKLKGVSLTRQVFQRARQGILKMQVIRGRQITDPQKALCYLIWLFVVNDGRQTQRGTPLYSMDDLEKDTRNLITRLFTDNNSDLIKCLGRLRPLTATKPVRFQKLVLEILDKLTGGNIEGYANLVNMLLFSQTRPDYTSLSVDDRIDLLIDCLNRTYAKQKLRRVSYAKDLIKIRQGIIENFFKQWLEQPTSPKTQEMATIFIKKLSQDPVLSQDLLDWSKKNVQQVVNEQVRKQRAWKQYHNITQPVWI